MWGSILFDDSFFSILKGSLAALEAEEFGTRRVLDELAFCHNVPRFDCDRRRACLVDTGGLCPS